MAVIARAVSTPVTEPDGLVSFDKFRLFADGAITLQTFYSWKGDRWNNLAKTVFWLEGDDLLGEFANMCSADISLVFFKE